MNNPLAIDVARSVAARPEMQKASSDGDRVVQLYKIMYQRSPTPAELKMAREFVARIAGYVDEPPDAKAGKSVANTKATKRAAKALAVTATKVAAGEVQVKTEVKGGTIQNVGEKVSRKQPISPWEMLAQSMVCSNEFVYLN